MKKTLVAALLGATLLGGGAYAATQSAPLQDRPKADANGDGILTRAEAMAAAEARFARADADGNGQLTRDERRAMRAHRGHHRGPGMRGGRGGGEMRARLVERFDADKDGKLSDAERDAARTAMRSHGGGGEKRAKMLERFDTDKDGKLSDAERQAARAARKARHGGHMPPPADAPETPNGN